MRYQPTDMISRSQIWQQVYCGYGSWKKKRAPRALRAIRQSQVKTALRVEWLITSNGIMDSCQWIMRGKPTRNWVFWKKKDWKIKEKLTHQMNKRKNSQNSRNASLKNTVQTTLIKLTIQMQWHQWHAEILPQQTLQIRRVSDTPLKPLTLATPYPMQQPSKLHKGRDQYYSRNGITKIK